MSDEEIQLAKRAEYQRFDSLAAQRERETYACKACRGHGKRLMPNKRERGEPQSDYGPGFYGTCLDCNGTGKADMKELLR